MTNFEKEKYLGQWYEIARMDYFFERNLKNVTASYSIRPDGSLTVDNKGFDMKRKKWKESVGRAKFFGSPANGRLRVSFFWPVYAAYNVLEIDGDYEFALVAGKNLKYLWILSRTKDIPLTVRLKYLRKAQQLGFDTSQLIWVQQDK